MALREERGCEESVQRRSAETRVVALADPGNLGMVGRVRLSLVDGDDGISLWSGACESDHDTKGRWTNRHGRVLASETDKRDPCSVLAVVGGEEEGKRGDRRELGRSVQSRVSDWKTKPQRRSELTERRIPLLRESQPRRSSA